MSPACQQLLPVESVEVNVSYTSDITIIPLHWRTVLLAREQDSKTTHIFTTTTRSTGDK